MWRWRCLRDGFQIFWCAETDNYLLLVEKMTKVNTEHSIHLQSATLQGGAVGVYLLVADESEEFQAALKKVAQMANQNNRRVAILYVMDDEGFLHWGTVEKRIYNDMRTEAEKRIREVTHRLYELCGQPAAIYIDQGNTREAILKVLNADTNIRMLVLGAGTASSNPLVSYFTGKGLSSLKVPLLVVPDTL